MSQRRPTPVPRGEDLVWRLASTLIAGPLVWGLVGFGLDSWWGTSVMTPFGVLLGGGGALYSAWLLISALDGAPAPATTTTAPPRPEQEVRR